MSTSRTGGKGKKKRYKLRYDRIIAVGVVFIIIIVMLVSCIVSCSGKNNESSSEISSESVQTQTENTSLPVSETTS